MIELTEVEEKDLEYVYDVVKSQIDEEITKNNGKFPKEEVVRVELELPKNESQFSPMFWKHLLQFEYNSCMLEPCLSEKNVVFIRKHIG